MEAKKESLFPGFVLRRVAGANYLLNLTSPGAGYIKPLKLNDTGARIFEELNLGVEKGDIADSLASESGAAKEDIVSDIELFISQLRTYGVNL